MADVGNSENAAVAMSFIGTLLASLGLYRIKKIDDLPEKIAREYAAKTDVNQMKQELREDLNRVENKMDRLIEVMTK